MAIPVAAVAVGVGGYLNAAEAKRRERNITDRVGKYQGFPDEQLRAIITQYGGEMGEAAQRVLSTRAQSPTPTVTPSASASLAESVTQGGSGLILIGVVGVVVLLLLVRR